MSSVPPRLPRDICGQEVDIARHVRSVRNILVVHTVLQRAPILEARKTYMTKETAE